MALFQAGELQKLSQLRLALEAVVKNGDPAGAFLADNASQLSDPDAMDAFLAAPLDYAYDLRDLSLEAAARRQARKEPSLWREGGTFDPGDWRHLALAGAAVAMVVLLFRGWQGRKAGGGGV